MKKAYYQHPKISIVEIYLTTAVCSGGNGLPGKDADQDGGISDPRGWEAPIRKLIVH